MSLKSIIRGAARVVTWPVRAPVEAAKDAAEGVAVKLITQFALKAAYGALGSLGIILAQATAIHAPDKATAVIWSLYIGLGTGAVAVGKKLIQALWRKFVGAGDLPA